MKSLLTILLLACVLAILAATAVALLFSIQTGHPAWILAGVLILDSVALFMIGACILLRRTHRDCALGGSMGDRAG